MGIVKKSYINQAVAVASYDITGQGASRKKINTITVGKNTGAGTTQSFTATIGYATIGSAMTTMLTVAQITLTSSSTTLQVFDLGGIVIPENTYFIVKVSACGNVAMSVNYEEDSQ